MALAARAQVGSAPNLDSKDQPLVFKSKVNLIMAPVVVRDKKGIAIATLHQDDFQLFDNGKAQVISSFSVEAWLQNGSRRFHQWAIRRRRSPLSHPRSLRIASSDSTSTTCA
jgi:hypothetical protein